MFKKIYIVILHYGKVSVTKKCISSLEKYEKNFSEIVLVNNDPNVNLTQEMFAIKKQKLHIVVNKKNLGFAAGVNVGIKYALKEDAECIFLLNNDTIIDKGFLEKLLQVFKKYPRCGIVGPAITFQKHGEKIFDLGGKVNLLFGRTSHTEVTKIVDNIPNQVTYVSGCCMLIRKEVFRDIGFFDEHFFLYYEDVDFSLRASRKKWKSFIVPSAIIFHELSKAAGKLSFVATYHQAKSGIIFGRKYCTIRIVNILFLLVQSTLFLTKKKEAGIAAFRGLWDGLKML